MALVPNLIERCLCHHVGVTLHIIRTERLLLCSVRLSALDILFLMQVIETLLDSIISLHYFE